MIILHLCLGNYYAEETGYQEDLLAKQNALDGHSVYVLASTKNIKNGKFFNDKPCKYVNKYNVNVERLPYIFNMNNKVMEKIRIFSGLLDRINKIQPDIIMIHNMQFVDILTLRKYLKKHRNIKVIADNHASLFNSGNNFLSRWILHRGVYRYCIKRCIKYIDDIYAIGDLEKQLLINYYNLNEDTIRLLRLPARVEDEVLVDSIRVKTRESMEIREDFVVYMHSGKMNEAKGTLELVKCFHNSNNDKIILLLAGVFDDKSRNEILKIIHKDSRIIYLGWVDNKKLFDLLCASDFYIQHKSVTITVQQALCCGCALVLSKHFVSYKELIKGNGFLIGSIDELGDIIKAKHDVNMYRRISMALGRELFDIREIAQILY